MEDMFVGDHVSLVQDQLPVEVLHSFDDDPPEFEDNDGSNSEKENIPTNLAGCKLKANSEEFRVGKEVQMAISL
jgi:hypothetical protein